MPYVGCTRADGLATGKRRREKAGARGQCRKKESERERRANGARARRSFIGPRSFGLFCDDSPPIVSFAPTDEFPRKFGRAVGTQ